MKNQASSRFGARSTTSEVLAGIDLRGKQSLITGGSSGLGRETASALATAGAAVLFTGRNVAAGERASNEIRDKTGNQAVEFQALDQTSVEDVNDFAQAMRERFPKLDMLILNAAHMTPNLERNQQGIEAQFMTSYTAHQIIAATLAPSLIAAAPARIVVLSSSGHKLAPIAVEDINFERRSYDALLAYGQSKTASALLAVALNERLAAQGVLAFAVHPGVIMSTGLSRNVGGRPNEEEQIAKYSVPEWALKSEAEGAAATVWAATASELGTSGGGKYLEDCKVAELGGGPYSGVEPYALDPAGAARLWALSEEMLGRSLPGQGT